MCLNQSSNYKLINDFNALLLRHILEPFFLNSPIMHLYFSFQIVDQILESRNKGEKATDFIQLMANAHTEGKVSQICMEVINRKDDDSAKSVCSRNTLVVVFFYEFLIRLWMMVKFWMVLFVGTDNQQKVSDGKFYE